MVILPLLSRFQRLPRSIGPLAALLAASVAACDISGPGGAGGPPTQLTGLPRSLTADESRVAAVANQFTFTLFQRLNAAQPPENVFVSPLSVSFALGMTMNGAAGQTFDEIRATLGFDADDLAKINAGYRGLLSLEKGLDPSTTFEIANSVWSRNTLPLLPSFVTSMKDVFDADVKSSPFDASTLADVNSWVNGRTAGKIPTILESIDSSSVMLLLNAIYFKGSWRDRFDPGKTQPRRFQGTGGNQQVPTMRRDPGEGTIRYGGGAFGYAGELSYGNGAFVMTIVVPNDMNALTASLDTATWRAIVASLDSATWAVELPKFQLEYLRELNSDLQAMGMQVPFHPVDASFAHMSPAGDSLYISRARHKTFVDVNEEGTEAAAITAVIIDIFDSDSGPPCLCVDRPFVFLIRERFSGTILFIGKILNVPT